MFKFGKLSQFVKLEPEVHLICMYISHQSDWLIHMLLCKRITYAKSFKLVWKVNIQGLIAKRRLYSEQVCTKLSNYIYINILILKVHCNDFVVLIGTAHKGVSISNLWIFDMRVAYSQRLNRKGLPETAVMLCKLNKSL